MSFQRDAVFLSTTALALLTSMTLTVTGCRSMEAMGDMPMPGGLSMSMMWMPGDDWLRAGGSFLGMWAVMMVAMMLPSLVPTLSRYRKIAGGRNLGGRTAMVAANYFLVWTLVGLGFFPLGLWLGSLEMARPELVHIVPFGAGLVVLLAGLIQLSRWKVRHLVGCRECHGIPDQRSGWAATRFGLRLGWHCNLCCAGFTAILMTMGVMDLRVMALVTAAITLERVAPRGVRVARGIGFALVVMGGFLIARAI
jgi:predicted metal-binding membrane protein